MKRLGSEFLIIVIFVDDIKFVSNSMPMVEHLKKALVSTFDIKLFGILLSFNG